MKTLPCGPMSASTRSADALSAPKSKHLLSVCTEAGRSAIGMAPGVPMTPLATFTYPVPVARFSSLPFVPLNSVISPSTDVLVLVEASPVPVPACPVSPFGIVKLKIADEDVPLFVMTALDPAAPVVIVPTAMVAAAPLEPFVPSAPLDPAGPIEPVEIRQVAVVVPENVSVADGTNGS